MRAGFFVLESFHRLVYEQEQDAVLWSFLFAQLNKIEHASAEKHDLNILLADFKKELLNVLGYRQNINEQEIDYFLQSLSSQKFSSLRLLNNG